MDALAQPMLQRAIYDSDAEIDIGDAFYQGFVGGTVGTLAGGLEVISEQDLSDGFLSGFWGEDYTEYRKYASVLQELAPHSFDEFLEIKEDPIKWSDLQSDYQILDMYKIDSGKLSCTDVLHLDNVVFSEKSNNFNSAYKRSGNIAGAFLDDDTETMYYAHSRISDKITGYKGQSKLIPLKNQLRFNYIDVPNGDGTMRTDTWHDTEAKLFEYFADLYEINPYTSITMISQRGICNSCRGVMEQFQALHPDVQINLISNKSVTGNTWSKLKRRDRDG